MAREIKCEYMEGGTERGEIINGKINCEGPRQGKGMILIRVKKGEMRKDKWNNERNIYKANNNRKILNFYLILINLQ